MSALSTARQLRVPGVSDYENDLVMGAVVLMVCAMATLYAILTHDRSDNIWIIYGSAVAFAAGRAGTHVLHRTRSAGVTDG